MAARLKFQREFAPNPHYRTAPVAHHIPIATVRHNVYVLTDGSLVAVFRVKGMEVELADGPDIAAYCEALRAVYNTLPPGAQFKLLHRITHNARVLLDAHERELAGSNAVARYVAWDQLRRLRRAMACGEILNSENLVCVTYNPRVRWWEARDRARAFRDAALAVADRASVVQRTAAVFRLALEKFEAAVRPIASQMALAGLAPERLTDVELYALAWETLNPSEALRRPVPPIVPPAAQDPYSGFFANGKGRALAQKYPAMTVVAPVTEREQLAVSDWVVGDKWVRIDDVYYGAVSLRVLPTHHYPTLALKLAGIPFASTLCIDLVMMQKQRELERLWNRVRSEKSKAAATLFGGTPDPALAERAESKERGYLQLSAGDEHPFRFRLVVTVGASTPEELTERCDLVLALLRSLDGAQGIRAHYAVPEVIQTTWPFSLVSDLDARKLMTSQAANLTPLFGRWDGSVRPVTLVFDTSRRLVKHDPFPRGAGILNRNRVVCGTSGSGKSVAMQALDVQPHLARANTEVLIMESGGSFELTTRAFGGVYVRLGPRCQYDKNPFDLPDGFFDYNATEQEASLSYQYAFIKNFVVSLARLTDPVEQQLAENVIGVVVQRTYQEQLPTRTVPRFRDFYRHLGEYRNERFAEAEALAAKLRLLLANYVVTEEGEAGLYSRYFDCFTTFDVESPLIAFDLLDVADDETLAMPLAMVTEGNLIFNRLLRRDGKERLAIVDEAMKQLRKLKGGAQAPSAMLLEMMVREVRKFGGGLTVAVQGYSDITNDPVGRVIVDCSAIVYFLKHERSRSNDEAFRAADFSREKAGRVYDLHTKYGEYSEMLIKEADHWGVVRLPVIGLRYWLCTNDDKDRPVRDRYFKTYADGHGCTTFEVVALLAADYPGGTHAPHGAEMSVDEGLRFRSWFADHFGRFAALVAAGQPVPADFA